MPLSDNGAVSIRLFEAISFPLGALWSDTASTADRQGIPA